MFRQQRTIHCCSKCPPAGVQAQTMGGQHANWTSPQTIAFERSLPAKKTLQTARQNHAGVTLHPHGSQFAYWGRQLGIACRFGLQKHYSDVGTNDPPRADVTFEVKERRWIFKSPKAVEPQFECPTKSNGASRQIQHASTIGVLIVCFAEAIRVNHSSRRVF